MTLTLQGLFGMLADVREDKPSQDATTQPHPTGYDSGYGCDVV